MTAVIERIIPYITLMKPRITTLVGITAFVGAVSGAVDSDYLNIERIFISTVLIIMSAAGAAIMNNYLDRDIDRLMHRTRERPLVSGRASSGIAIILSILLSGLSVILLYALNPLSGFLALLAIISYSLLYTIYLKRHTPWASIIGSLPGALPPVIGYAATSGGIGIDALILFSILLIWQPPHFWHLASMLKKDYERAGIPVLPVVYGETFTRNLTFLFSLLMALFIVIPGVLDFTGKLYLYGSIVISLVWIMVSAGAYMGKVNNRLAFILSNITVLLSFMLFAFDKLQHV